jgi:signal transduction histidine kinase
LAKHRLDIAVGVASALLVAITTAARGAGVLDVLIAGVFGATLGLCRARPTVAWVVAAGAIAALAPQDGAHWLPFPLVAVTAFGAGRWADRTSAVTAFVALISLSLLVAATSHSSAVPNALVPGVGWLVGRAIRERELLAQRLAERAHELEQEREAYAELSVKYERTRIASELHDIVAHAISVMVVQATAGQRLAATNPQLTTEAFHAIADAAHGAEEDIGRLVALLADDQATGPAADLEPVEEIVARAAATGLDVTLTLEGTSQGLPSDVIHTATRVIQESLTNALRYASGAPVQVLISNEQDTVIVEVTNDSAPSVSTLAGHSTGNGLRGLRERLSACGGRLEAGPTADGGRQIRARIPRHGDRLPRSPTAQPPCQHRLRSGDRDR